MYFSRIVYHEDSLSFSRSCLHHHHPSSGLNLLHLLHSSRQQLGPAVKLPLQRPLVDLLLGHL